GMASADARRHVRRQEAGSRILSLRPYANAGPPRRRRFQPRQVVARRTLENHPGGRRQPRTLTWPCHIDSERGQSGRLEKKRLPETNELLISPRTNDLLR